MLNDELEKIWRDYAKAEGVKLDKNEFLSELNSQLKNFDRILKNRDRREIIAAVIVILCFGTGAFFFTEILSRIGMILGVLYGIVVIIVIKKVKKQKPAGYAIPVNEYLVKYRRYLAKQRSLLKNVIYWYLLPPFVACLLFFIGQKLSITHLTINIIIILSIYTAIYFLNKSGVKKAFDPLIKKLDETINDFETSE